MSCGGLNQFLAIPVPAINGDGPLLDVSGVVAQKTFYVSGDFDGRYVLLGSHDDVRFVPVAQFDSARGQQAGQAAGPQTIVRTVVLTLKSVKMRRLSNTTVNAAVAAQATCPCT